MNKIKNEIFENYSRNLELVISKIAPERVNEFRNKYICPLCRRVFSIESLDSSLTEHLTIEDIPPKSVGWKRKILTCKTCNNKHGGKIDSHLPIVLNRRAFINRIPNKSVDIKLKFNSDKQLNAELIFRGNNEFEIYANPNINNPVNLKNLNSIFENNEIPPLIIEMKSGNIKKAKLSLIRAAYLWGFHELGYAFIFNPHFDNFIQQLEGSEKEIIPLDSVITKKEEFLNEGVYLLEFSESKYLYAISMFVKSNEFSENVIVFFSTPSDYTNSGLNKVREIINGGLKHKLKYINLNYSEIMHDSEKCILPLVAFGLYNNT